MRIIAGEFRGIRLQAPKGDTTRPTTDRVKESCMSALENARGGFEGAFVLDAFAGSGALGLEALSRGAAFCQFHEKDARVAAVLQNNIANLRLTNAQYKLNRGDVLKSAFPGREFDVVLLDPPYKMTSEAIFDFVEKLHRTDSLAEDALLLYEHSYTTTMPEHHASNTLQYKTVFQKKYGDTIIDLITISSPDQ